MSKSKFSEPNGLGIIRELAFGRMALFFDYWRKFRIVSLFWRMEHGKRKRLEFYLVYPTGMTDKMLFSFPESPMNQRERRSRQDYVSACPRIPVLLAFIFSLVIAAPVRATVLYTFSQGGNGPASDGPVSAEALFSTFTNFTTIDGHTYSGIEIQIANLEQLTGGNGEGQAISGITFTLGPSLKTSGISLVQDQGPEVTTTSNGFVTGPTTVTGTQSTFSGNFQPNPDPFFHWGSSASTSAVTLQTAGNAAQGHQPNHLIIGELSGGSYNPSYQNHDPSFFSPSLPTATTFWIVDPNVSNLDPTKGLTLSDITSVNFFFGTGPAEGGPATGSNVPPLISTPEPSSILLLGGLGAFGLVGSVVRSIRRQLAGAF